MYLGKRVKKASPGKHIAQPRAKDSAVGALLWTASRRGGEIRRYQPRVRSAILAGMSYMYDKPAGTRAC